MNPLVFNLVSRIPGTGPWRAYRETRRFLYAADACVREMVPGVPPLPVWALPRDPASMVMAVEAMTNMVTGLGLYAEGKHDQAAEFLVPMGQNW